MCECDKRIEELEARVAKLERMADTALECRDIMAERISKLERMNELGITEQDIAETGWPREPAER